ncbi:glycosyltransferase family 2 protein [Lapillicoccus jejuensis]|uniref:Glycosyl transferase family 2 n=1 Tax=Lapillicoccus jejuensis TaxID=402171 RepID=A0A542E205_9MICO|nr:glycosyltransferase family 2 protein [Lapillicoccus jejuensis]TQJ09381.1 glycosyl transferase family 2 [Lapillicoccus jejuensis]
MSTVMVVIPAHDEAGSIGETLTAVLAQERPADLVVVVPNGCTDDTAQVARDAAGDDPRVVVWELPRLAHRKSEALNRAWARFGDDHDYLVCLDGDTVLPPNAIGDWVAELDADATLGGSSSKFTMLGGDLLTRLQRAEFAKWTVSALDRGWTSVLAGTGCIIRGSALREVAARPDRQGPYSYDSTTEDFELTYRIRELGYRCQVSPTVRAYTDSMRTVRALWGQRMKWQVGTVEDLMTFGVGRRTALDWWQQVLGLAAAFVRVSFVLMMGVNLALGTLSWHWYWWLAPLVFVANDVKQSLRIPHRDRRDVLLAALLVPQEAFAWMRAAWFLVGWGAALRSRVTGVRVDRWALQYAAEGR